MQFMNSSLRVVLWSPFPCPLRKPLQSVQHQYQDLMNALDSAQYIHQDSKAFITQPDLTTFFSYLLTFELNLYEFLKITGQMGPHIILLSTKPTKMNSDFILNYLRRLQGAPLLRNIKNKYKYPDIFYMDVPPGTQGVSIEVLLST